MQLELTRNSYRLIQPLVRVVTWYMGSGLKAQNMTGIRAQRKGLRAQKNEIRDHKAFEPESGIRFITRSTNLLSHKISWPRYITYSYFRLVAVPVIRSPGCLTKTWYHILKLFYCWGPRNMNLKSLFLLCNSTPQRAVKRPKAEKAIYTYLFLREMGKKKKDKKKSCDRERYVSTSLTDLLLARVQA